MNMEESAIDEIARLESIIIKLQAIKLIDDRVIEQMNDNHYAMQCQLDDLIDRNAEVEKILYQSGFHEYGIAEKERKLN